MSEEQLSYLVPELETAAVRTRICLLRGVIIGYEGLNWVFLCPACNADLPSVIAVDLISDNRRRTMVKSSNSNNNIMTAKQKAGGKLELILDRMNTKAREK